MDLVELENISNDLDSTIQGSCKYYHYNCDNFNDIGWGCGYRTLQTMCSWIRERLFEKKMPAAPVPSLVEIQQILHKCQDKPANFVNSKQWIGCFEASIVIDYLYDVPCKFEKLVPRVFLNLKIFYFKVKYYTVLLELY